MQKYIQINKNLWNQKTAIHIRSNFYDVAAFVAGKSSLNQIELDLLGDVKDKKILHLQCHFGQDTLSLARLGAKIIGVDLSDKAIEKARALAAQLQLNAQFICCDVQELDKHLGEQFDIVFTSYGTIAWLPRLDKWGQLIYQFLRLDGQFIMAEFHPMIWMLDDNFERIEYPYFNTKIFYETYTTSYTDGGVHPPTMGYSWNHPISEVLQSLIHNRLIIRSFQEYDYSPYNCFPNVIKTEKGYQIKGFEGKLAMVYSIVAEKENF